MKSLKIINTFEEGYFLNCECCHKQCVEATLQNGLFYCIGCSLKRVAERSVRKLAFAANKMTGFSQKGNC